MWKTVTLGNSCKMYQPKTISAKEMLADGEYVVFGANGVIGKYNQYNHSEPQLLVTCRGATCGAVNVSQPFSWINGNAMVIQPDLNKISFKYMEYLFRGGIDLTKAITGAAQPQITRQSLEPIEFSYPPLAEQQRIVAKLDAAFAEIDKAFASTTKKTQHLETLSVQSINEIITKNCTEVITKPLQALFKLSSGKFLPKNEMQGDGNVKVYGGNGVAGTHNIANLQGQNVIIGRVGAKCGNVHFVNERIWLTDNAMYVHSLKNEFNLQFLTTILASLNLGSYARQSAQPVISFSSIKDVVVSFPISLEEQNKVVEELDKFKTSFDELVDIYSYKSKQLDALKSAILVQELQSEAA